MIPIRLTFEAFGPFPKKQVIDFTKFDDDRIFLITGPTGSGKTTIFDAITFSLFGDTSGSTRSRNTLKSDFVGDTALCYTEFTFRIHGTEYTVRRIPAQTCPNARGNGTKVQAADAELRDENGVLCTRVRDVDKKIEELIGLNYEQFRKIVLLPQGEFRRFLSDSSEAKQEILRHIFSTELLGRFTEELKTRVSSLSADYQHALSQCSAHLDTIRAEEESALYPLLSAKEPDIDAIITALAEQNEIQRQKRDKTAEALREARKKADQINPELAARENETIEQYRKAEAEFAEMNRHNTEWSQKKEWILRLEKAVPLKQKNDEIAQEQNTLSLLLTNKTKQENEKATLTQDLSAAKEATARAEQDLLKAREKAEEIPALRELVKQLTAFRETERDIQTRTEQIAKNERQLKILAEAKLRLAEKTILDELEKEIRAREQFFDLIPQYNRAADDAAKASSQTTQALSAYIAAQAPFLAENLKENEPCPVCGSLSHPNPAKAHAHAGSKEAYETARNNEAKAVQRRDRLYHDLQALLSEENDGKDPFTCIENEQTILHSLKEQHETHHAAFSAFRIPEVLLNEDAEKLEQRIRDITTRYQSALGMLDLLKTQIETLRTAIPDGADEKTVSTKIIVLTAELDEATEALNEAKEKQTKIQGDFIRSETVLSETLRRIDETNELIRVRSEAFSALLIASEFTMEMYQELAPHLSKLSTLQEEFRQYKQDFRTKRDLVQNLKEQTKEMTEHDLDAIRAAKSEAQTLCDQLQASFNDIDRILHTNERAEDHLRAQSRKEKNLREKYEQARFLYGVARGDYSGKVNFERYVLAHYFENVIQNANIRLEQMTNSRYTLIRRTASEGHNRASGLEMDVFDSYTGLSRHVDTLSGGESFKVALALALGLADIISENSGGIEIGTMLIDEGFGSLDSDSLDAAITCLHDLQADGRYIGIISHVAELRERIPQRIVIKPGVNGSRIVEEER